MAVTTDGVTQVKHQLHTRNLALLELLADIDRHFGSSYAIFGSTALSCYFGYPIDSHRDVDVIVNLSQHEIARVIEVAGWSVVGSNDRTMGSPEPIAISPDSHIIACRSAGTKHRLHVDIRVLSAERGVPTIWGNTLRYFPIRDWSERRRLRIRWFEPDCFTEVETLVLSPESALATFFLSPITPEMIVASALLRPLMLAAEERAERLYEKVPLFDEMARPNWQYSKTHSTVIRQACLRVG